MSMIIKYIRKIPTVHHLIVLY